MKNLIVFGLFLLACGARMNSWAAEEQVTTETAATAAVVQGNTAFALDLYGQLRSREGNLFFSPLSLSTAFAMAYAGARGQTAEQMATVLHFPSDQEQMHQAFAALNASLLDDNKDKEYQLYIANALWGQQGYHFREDFLQTTKTYYGAGLNEVDFQTATEDARKTINTWVEQQTKDRIHDLIPPGALNNLTRLVLSNAIYFKGKWVRPFEKEQTKDAAFHVTPTQQITVPMMHQTESFGYLDGGGFQALALPYVGEALSMVIFLPKQVDGLAAFEKTLTGEKLTKWLSQLQAREVVVSLPRFTMTAEFALKQPLADMGMPVAFREENADFSGISEKGKLHISEAFHKAFVDVNEEGTEAAAATGIIARTTSALREPPPVFRADHPFLFLIRDTRSGSILFLGRSVQPQG